MHAVEIPPSPSTMPNVPSAWSQTILNGSESFAPLDFDMLPKVHELPASERQSVLRLLGSFVGATEIFRTLAFDALCDDLTRDRSSEDAEDFVFRTLKPAIEEHGVPILTRIDELVQGGKVSELVRHYYAYMLSYTEGAPVHNYCLTLLLRYRGSKDQWLRSGAEEGLEHLISA